MSDLQALRESLSGLLKARGGFTGFPELELAPVSTLRAKDGQYMTRDTPIRYDARKGLVGAAAFGGGRGTFSMVYRRVDVSTTHYLSDLGLITDEELEQFEAGAAGVDVLGDHVDQIRESWCATFAAELQTAVAALSAAPTATLALTTAGTAIAKPIREAVMQIRKTTGSKGRAVFGVGPDAAHLMATVNTEIRQQIGNASTGGATAGYVNEEGLKQWFKRACNVDLLILDRPITNTSGSAAYQWTTTGALVIAEPGAAPSCFKTFAPNAELHTLVTDRVPQVSGGPGTSVGAQGSWKLATVDSDLGLKFTLTIA